MTDGDQDLVNTQPILTFAQNSNTLFSGGSGYDFGTTKNFGVINVKSGATDKICARNINQNCFAQIQLIGLNAKLSV